MPVLQAAWVFYSHNSALVVNALGLFYALSGSWLLIATRIRSSRSTNALATSPTTPGQLPAPATQRINRMFNRVGTLCLAGGLLLSLISTQL